jgi:acyl-CoA-binding protein
MLQTAQGWKNVMSALPDRFAQAQQDVNSLPSRPDNDTMLKLYALYKQATKGDATSFASYD